MKYVIVESGGKQYKATEGETVIVDKVEGKVGSQFVFDHVMFYRNGEEIEIGTPLLPNVAVTGKLLETKKGKKIRIAKFKAKVRYRKVMGFRPYHSHIQIEKITSKTSFSEKKVRDRRRPIKSVKKAS